MLDSAGAAMWDIRENDIAESPDSLRGEEAAALLRRCLCPARVHEICGPGARAFAALAAGPTPCLWIVSAHRGERLCPQGLAEVLDPARLLSVQANDARQALWCAEQALRSGAAGIVIAELDAPTDLTVSRRLQLAARAGGATGLCLVPDLPASNAMETRWRTAPLPSKRGRARQKWDCIKNKKGIYHALTVERTRSGWRKVSEEDAARSLSLVSLSGDRPRPAA